VALNFSDAERRVDLGPGAVRDGLRTTHRAPLPAEAKDVTLAPCEGVVLVLD